MSCDCPEVESDSSKQGPVGFEAYELDLRGYGPIYTGLQPVQGGRGWVIRGAQ